MKAIEQTSKSPEDITKRRQKKKTCCMPTTAVSPNCKTYCSELRDLFGTDFS